MIDGGRRSDADLEIAERALRLGAPILVGGHLDWTERISLGAAPVVASLVFFAVISGSGLMRFSEGSSGRHSTDEHEQPICQR